MRTRQLVQAGVAAAVATVVAVPLGIATADRPAPPPRGPALTDTRVAGIDVDRTTVPQLQHYMDRGRLTSVALTRFYLQRIERLNPTLHAVITTSRTALADARAADRARARGDHRALLGIPILVKDNVDTTGMPTTAGSLALAGSTPPDAFIAKRLKAAGGLIIGKANLSEWANYRGDQSSSGWSAVGGQTNNPYALDRNPCGSSSGSAVGAAADLATVAIGTETDGSIVCPSGQNGVVGVKPTLGLASRTGIVPISSQQDTAGPITRNVTDASVVLGAITGVDPADPATAAQRGHVRSDYRAALDAQALRGARIGVWRQGIEGASPETDAIFDHTVARLKQLGATVVDPADIVLSDAVNEGENTALQYEFKHDIGAYLAGTAPRYPKTLADLIRFNRDHAARELQWFGQETFLAAQQRGPLADAAYVKARRAATDGARAAIDSVLTKYRLDAVVAPTNSPAWTTDLVNGDHFLLGSSGPSAVSGYPSVTVPAGYSSGLPVGLSFLGGRWDEAGLLGLAYAWEQATHVRVKPTFRASVP